MTAGERTAVLDDRLRRGYETFDDFILSERERESNQSNAAGSVQVGAETGDGAAGARNMPQTMEAAGQQTVTGGAILAGQSSSSTPPPPGQAFPPPEDIPSGRDDDVVARQLREAAMNEPDPELREALWDEYRNYTGLSQGDDQ